MRWTITMVIALASMACLGCGDKAPPLPDLSDSTAVDEYISGILSRAAKKGGFSEADQEVQWLERVGAGNLDRLLGKLVAMNRDNGDMWVVAAIDALATDAHRDLIVNRLAEAPSLMRILTRHNWLRAARLVLVRGLRARAPYVTTEWVVAAAQVSEPAEQESLKYYLVTDENALAVWRAIHALPGMEPLDVLVADAWRSVLTEGRKTWRGRQWALVAARYGHMDALVAVAGDLDEGENWPEFRLLTGYDGPREKATVWFEENRPRLRFDRDGQRHYLPQR